MLRSRPARHRKAASPSRGARRTGPLLAELDDPCLDALQADPAVARRCDAARTRQLPVRGWAGAEPQLPRPVNPQHEPDGVLADDRRRAVDQPRVVAEPPDPPMGVLPQGDEVVEALLDELALGDRGVIQAGV